MLLCTASSTFLSSGMTVGFMVMGHFQIWMLTMMHVEVPESAITLNTAQHHQLQASIDPLSEDCNHGVTLYMSALRTVQEFFTI